jgi:catechol 2,3-dioxygenase-like lactoylglutathione lyase family enzyme
MVESTASEVVHHFGYSVSDIDRSLAFWESLGATLIVKGSIDGPEAERGNGLKGAAHTIVMLSIGNARVELLQWTSPEPAPFTRRLCDIGTAHVAIAVPDVHARYEATKSTLDYVSAPQTVPDGEFAGSVFCYLRDPDGVPVELIQQ